MACSCVGTLVLQKVLGKAFLGRRLALLGPVGTVCTCGTASSCWNVPGKSGPHGKLFFFLFKKEPVVASDDGSYNSFVTAETLKACALLVYTFWKQEVKLGQVVVNLLF